MNVSSIIYSAPYHIHTYMIIQQINPKLRASLHYQYISNRGSPEQSPAQRGMEKNTNKIPVANKGELQSNKQSRLHTYIALIHCYNSVPGHMTHALVIHRKFGRRYIMMQTTQRTSKQIRRKSLKYSTKWCLPIQITVEISWSPHRKRYIPSSCG